MCCRAKCEMTANSQVLFSAIGSGCWVCRFCHTPVGAERCPSPCPARTATTERACRCLTCLGLTSRSRAGVDGSWRDLRRRAPIAQLAEAADLKSAQCGFESHWGHGICAVRVLAHCLARLGRRLSLRTRYATLRGCTCLPPRLANIGAAPKKANSCARIVAPAHPHLRCTSFDLPLVTEIAQRRVNGPEAKVLSSPHQVGNTVVNPATNPTTLTKTLTLADTVTNSDSVTVADPSTPQMPLATAAVPSTPADPARRVAIAIRA